MLDPETPQIPDLVVPQRRRAPSTPPPVWPEVPDLVVPARPLRLPDANGLRVGLTGREVCELDFGTCPSERAPCACTACQVVEGLVCVCGCHFIDHAVPNEDGPADDGCTLCEGCTDFSLAYWTGGPEAPPGRRRLEPLPAPPAPPSPPERVAAAMPRPRRRRRSPAAQEPIDGDA